MWSRKGASAARHSLCPVICWSPVLLRELEIVCRKCFAPLLGFSLPSTSFSVSSIKLQTAGSPIATTSTAMIYFASRGVCRIAATVALWDGKLFCVPWSSDHSLRKQTRSQTEEEHAVIATLDSCVCKAVCFTLSTLPAMPTSSL